MTDMPSGTSCETDGQRSDRNRLSLKTRKQSNLRPFYTQWAVSTQELPLRQ